MSPMGRLDGRAAVAALLGPVALALRAFRGERFSRGSRPGRVDQRSHRGKPLAYSPGAGEGAVEDGPVSSVFP